MSKKNPTRTTLSSGLPWCCTATAERRSTDNDNNNNDDDEIVLQSHQTPLTSVQWMQQLEQAAGPESYPDRSSAYDTLRADLPTNEIQDKDAKVWGLDFHLDRLQRSYQSTTKTKHMSPRTLQRARHASITLMQALLQRAQNELPPLQSTTPTTTNSLDTIIYIVRVTWLWSTPWQQTNHDNDDNDDHHHHRHNHDDIIVRAHAVCTGQSVPVYGPTPITCSVAALLDDKNQVTVDHTLPTRHSKPQSKVPAWTVQRQSLDHYKPKDDVGCSEILLVRTAKSTIHNKKGIELLEGSSSNVFCVYRDGTLRTPDQGVLHGYVRHLVLESAAACGLRIDTTTPILLEEVAEWKEVFITSSSRLIYPIQRIIIPTGSNGQETTRQFREFWRDPWFDNDNNNSQHGQQQQQPKWQALLHAILRQGGYTIP